MHTRSVRVLIFHENRPETMGLPVAIIYLITLFLFIPFPFINWFEGANLVHEDDPTVGTFPYNKVSSVASLDTSLLMGVWCSWERYCQPYWRFSQ